MIGFGKYRDQPIESVFQNDINYCKWLYSNQEALNRNQEVKTFLQEHMKDICLDFVMAWGKHKGKTVEWIYMYDPDYFDWLLQSPFVATKCKRLREELFRAIGQ